MTYREHAPHPALGRHVECYWTIRHHVPPGKPVTATVLPDGCMDIIVALGSPAGSRHGSRGAPYVVGTMTRPLDVHYPGEVDLVGVRFRPGGSGPYLRIEAFEITDRAVTLSDLWGARASELHERLAAAGPDDDRIAILDEVLLARAAHTRADLDESVLRASALAEATRTSMRVVDEMAVAAALGRRQLERRFLASVGIGPKALSRILRFRRAVEILHAQPRVPLSAVALRAGYADQPHLTREFAALAGTTPARYRRERIDARDVFVQDAGVATG